MVTQDQVIIETDQGVKTYPRSALVSIVEAEPGKRSWWATKRTSSSGICKARSNLFVSRSNMRTLESAHSSESWPISSPRHLPTAP